METALEEVEFLARSENRVEVLRAVADGPRSRADLAAATGASQATLGRILGDFEERSWIERHDGAYTATLTGRLVAEGVTDLLDVLATERKLRDVVAYLPAEELTVDLRHLSDATVVTPSGTRPDAPLQRLLDMEREASRLRAFSHAFNERSLTISAERVSAGELTFEGVFSRPAVDALANDVELRQTFASLLTAEDARVRVHEGAIPLAGSIVDDDVHLLVRDDTGVLRASIDTDDPAVFEWAVETFESYWDAASPLEREDLFGR